VADGGGGAAGLEAGCTPSARGDRDARRARLGETGRAFGRAVELCRGLGDDAALARGAWGLWTTGCSPGDLRGRCRWPRRRGGRRAHPPRASGRGRSPRSA
jgi:hypothetical protein